MLKSYVYGKEEELRAKISEKKRTNNLLKPKYTKGGKDGIWMSYYHQDESLLRTLHLSRFIY